jgi:hypothetical protein
MFYRIDRTGWLKQARRAAARRAGSDPPALRFGLPSVRSPTRLPDPASFFPRRGNLSRILQGGCALIGSALKSGDGLPESEGVRAGGPASHLRAWKSRIWHVPWNFGTIEISVASFQNVREQRRILLAFFAQRDRVGAERGLWATALGSYKNLNGCRRTTERRATRLNRGAR